MTVQWCPANDGNMTKRMLICTRKKKSQKLSEIYSIDK